MRMARTATGHADADCPGRTRIKSMRNFRQNGVTLIELLVVIVIVAILATAALPMSRMTVKRVKEIELRASLRTLRKAIDDYKSDCDNKKLSTIEGYCQSEQNNYPESLEKLTEPLKLAGATDKTRKYLRRLPRDPLTGQESSGNSNNWGLRSYSDPADSTSWGGGNVYDVYSKSDRIALDGSRYDTW